MKTVFNQFCLGGNTQSTLETLTTDVTTQQISTSSALHTFKHLNKIHQLESINGLIHSISRHETPGDWINYIAWKVKLVRLYGSGQDISNFPLYATSRSSKFNAINAQKGYAKFQWQLENYNISLTWDQIDFIVLKYTLTQQNHEQGNAEGL